MLTLISSLLYPQDSAPYLARNRHSRNTPWVNSVKWFLRLWTRAPLFHTIQNSPLLSIDISDSIIPRDKKGQGFSFPWDFTPAKELKEIITSFGFTDLWWTNDGCLTEGKGKVLTVSYFQNQNLSPPLWNDINKNLKGRFAANNGKYHIDFDLILPIWCFSDKVVCCEYLYGKFHFLVDFHYYLKTCFAQKKIGLNTENHILKSIQLLLVCSLSTFNSLLPEELIKWTIDPYNLCTFIKSTPTLQYIRLIMPISLEFPTAWTGLEYISRHNGSAIVAGLWHKAEM